MNTEIQAAPAGPTYDARTIALHWLSAALVVGLWGLGQIIDFFPRGVPQVTVRSLHITFGVVLAIVLLARIIWRNSGGIKLAAADSGALGKAAVAVHHLLYALLVAVVVIGLACVWIRGDNIFNLFTIPSFDPGNKALRHNAVELHEWVANMLLAAAALHAAAALWHHLQLKDGVLLRMWPRPVVKPGQ